MKIDLAEMGRYRGLVSGVSLKEGGLLLRCDIYECLVYPSQTRESGEREKRSPLEIGRRGYLNPEDVWVDPFQGPFVPYTLTVYRALRTVWSHAMKRKCASIFRTQFPSLYDEAIRLDVFPRVESSPSEENAAYDWREQVLREQYQERCEQDAESHKLAWYDRIDGLAITPFSLDYYLEHGDLLWVGEQTNSKGARRTFRISRRDTRITPFLLTVEHVVYDNGVPCITSPEESNHPGWSSIEDLYTFLDPEEMAALRFLEKRDWFFIEKTDTWEELKSLPVFTSK